MPAVSVMSLSHDPALVGVASAPAHATCKAIMKSRCFSVSWLDAKYRDAVEALGSASGDEEGDKLGSVGLHHRLGGSPPVPLVRESSAYLVCTLVESHPFGDHCLLVAQVRVARAIADFREYWGFRAYHPLLYAGLGRPPPGAHERLRRP